MKGISIPVKLTYFIIESSVIVPVKVVPANDTLNTIRWNSSNPSVAIISACVVIKGLTADKTTIIATTL